MLNLGVEGMMAVGAVCGFAVALETGYPALGVLAAIVAGGVMALRSSASSRSSSSPTRSPRGWR